MATIKVPNPEWHEGSVGIDKWIRISMTRADMENYLGKDNQDEYTPVDDYNPATKKYVDDSKSQVIQQMNSSLLDKVDKEDGKGLSTNDYTTEEKNKLNNISNNLVSGISVSNSTSPDRVKITYSDTDTTTGDIVSKDLYLQGATSEFAGLMISSDKTKLDGVEDSANNYSLPAATDTNLGGIQTGYTQSGKNYPVKLDDGNKAYVNIPWSDTIYDVATQTENGLMSSTDKKKLDGIENGANNYTLPKASTTQLGGIQLGFTEQGKNYPLELDENGKAYVNIPWSNTTYSTFKAATSSAAGGTGLVPAPAAGKQTSFLRGDGTWVVPTNTNTTYTFASGTGAFTVTPSGGSAQTVSIGKPATAGAADTATKLSTARAINGTNFDGTAAITTANWGTSRTLTIGNTSKSVNGSANVSWSLGEIGAAASSHTHSYLPLSGGTLTGALTFSNYSSKLTTGETIAMKNSKGQVQDVIRCYDDGDTDANGSELVIQAGGNVYIGSGESASALKTAIGTNSGETMKISSDDNIEFYTNCQTIANRVGVILNSSRAFYPNSNNTGTLGTSSNKWNNVYATTFTGSLSGNASTASKLGTATVGSTSKPIYLNAGTATALSATVGAANKPVYMNAGTVTACSSTVGSATVPVYMNAGTVTQCTASSVFSNLSNSGNNISITVAGQNRTLTPAHAAKAGYVERDRGNNTVTTLASLPTSKRLILANLSTATTISVASGMNIGDEIYVVCTPSAAFTQPIPNSGSFRSMSGTSLSVTSGVHFEISILCIATSGVMYSISIKEKD